MTPEEANREQALTALVEHVLRWPNDPALSPTAWSLAQGYLTLKARLSAVEAERDQLRAKFLSASQFLALHRQKGCDVPDFRADRLRADR